MKKYIKCIKKLIYLTIISILFNVNIVLAETSETTVNLGEKEEVIFDSDGQTGHNTQNAGGDYTNNTNSETTYNYSQNESNALTCRSNIYNTVSGWYSQLQSNTADFYTSGIGENISTITFGTVPKSEVAGLINNVTTWEGIEGADWVKQNSLPTLKLTEDENSAYDTLTDDEKQDIRKQVVLNENPEGSIGIDVQTGSSLRRPASTGIRCRSPQGVPPSRGRTRCGRRCRCGRCGAAASRSATGNGTGFPQHLVQQQGLRCSPRGLRPQSSDGWHRPYRQHPNPQSQ